MTSSRRTKEGVVLETQGDHYEGGILRGKDEQPACKKKAAERSQVALSWLYKVRTNVQVSGKQESAEQLKENTEKA